MWCVAPWCSAVGCSLERQRTAYYSHTTTRTTIDAWGLGGARARVRR